MAKRAAFDVEVSAKKRAIVASAVHLALSAGLLMLGLWLLPGPHAWAFAAESLQHWDGWGFIGLVTMASGLFAFAKFILFAVWSFGQKGAWHFMLTSDQLTWKVPDHTFGEETSFSANLSDISWVENRTIERHELPDLTEYWIYFTNREPVELKSYSGVSLRWLISKIAEAGVEFRQTTVKE